MRATRAIRGRRLAGLAAALALVGGIGLAGCGTETGTVAEDVGTSSWSFPDVEAPETPAVEEDAVAEAPAEDSMSQLSEAQRERIFLELVREEYPHTSMIEDDVLIDAGRAAAEAYQRGASLETILLVAADSDLEDGLAAYIAGVGISAFAPEMQDQLTADLAELKQSY